MQPSKSHLRLCVLVNGEEILESDDLVGDDWVGEVREDSKTVVTSTGRTSENTHPLFPKHIQMLPQTRKHVDPRRPFQPVLSAFPRSAGYETGVSHYIRFSLGEKGKRGKGQHKERTKEEKKGKLTLRLKPKASLYPRQKIPPKKQITTKVQNNLPLPNGAFQAWLLFGDNGG
jgi:hypothetical protein